MTQNVKKSRASSFATALLLVGLGSWTGALGCSTDKPQPSAMDAAGSGGCAGLGCGAASGRFTPCKLASECDEAHGFSCVDGECSYACQSHADCVEVGHCEDRTLDGQHRSFCARDATPPVPGKLYTSCPNGDECADPTLCIGAGPGDLDAYCTIDCASDDDCAVGYFCGSIGDQDTPRSVCRQREFCSPCESTADCLAIPNQVCAKDESGEKICTRLCDSASDTRSCPWGNAAKCGNFDDDLGLATCSHRFGSCHGTGKTCEPCRSGADCPGGGCAASSFTGERWCVNFDTTCHCPNGPDATGTCADGGCPKAPSGLVIQCIGDESSSLFDVCYAANSGSQTQLGSSPQTGCWSGD